MCRHFRSAKNLSVDFVEQFDLRERERLFYDDMGSELLNGGAWPMLFVPALRIVDAGELETFDPEWGLLPQWWKPSNEQPMRESFQWTTLTAPSETASTTPAFRSAMKDRRCLVPFVEFLGRDQYFGTGEPMAFAGIWDCWQGDEGDVVSVAILTTAPNAEVSSVGHDRMPLLLDTPEVRRRWLVDGADNELLKRFPDGVLSIRAK